MVGDENPRPQDTQATFCATLVDEWIRLGVRHAVVAPGSRSTPMALALADRSELQVHVVHDERSAAFVALGLGIDGPPALLLCTSGTAAANFFPAVVEAGLSEVPMIVLTADRPEELRGVGAPQTIDQIDLYGKHVVWSRDPGVAEPGERSLWRELADDTMAHARSGPVQLNLAFREPLMGVSGALPDAVDRPLVAPPPRRPDAVPAGLDRARGVILVGGRSGVDPVDVAALHRATGVADHRRPDVGDATAPRRRHHGRQPVAPRSGSPMLTCPTSSSGSVGRRRRRCSPSGRRGRRPPERRLIQVGGPGVIDPDHNVAAVCSIAALLGLSGGSDRSWAESWAVADRVADAAIVDALAEFDELTEPGVARTVADHLADGVDLVVSSSMPVRDLEWFGGARARAFANRGANGIDGVVSTALGRALTGTPTCVLLGDLAFVHDSNALIGLTGAGRRSAGRRRRQRRWRDLLVPAAGGRTRGGPLRAALRNAAGRRRGRSRNVVRPRVPHGAVRRRAGRTAGDAGAVGLLCSDGSAPQRRRSCRTPRAVAGSLDAVDDRADPG